jgi:HEAT repeat protein
MAQPKTKVFGPLTYSTLAIALLAAATLGVIIAWPRLAEWRELWRLEADVRSDDPIIRESAVGALRNKGIAVCVPYLLKAARDPRGEVRAMACRWLVNVGADAQTVLQVLVGAAFDDEAEVRREVALALGRRVASQYLGMPAGLTPAESSTCVTTLRRLLKDAAATVRVAAAESLGETEPEPAASVDLGVALGDNDRAVRFAAARTLLRANRSGVTEAVKTLLGLISDPDWFADHRQALEALKDVRGEGEGLVVLWLAELLARDDLPDRKNQVRHYAIDMLMYSPLDTRPALPALEALVNDTDPDLRAHAVSAVARIAGKESPGAVKRLIAIVTGRPFSEDRRLSALGLLSDLDPVAAKKVSSTLIRQLADPDPEARSVALTLLQQIIYETPAEMPSPSDGP